MNNTGIVVLMAVAIGIAMAQEKKITRSELPAAVEKTVSAQSQGATIRGFSREVESGQTRYEAELMVDGHTKDILMDENGAIVEVEEQVAIDSIDPAVRNALLAKAGTRKIARVESITKQGRIVAYEAKIVRDGKRSEVQVGPDGKPLDHEE
jgi:hypothetical protein